METKMKAKTKTKTKTRQNNESTERRRTEDEGGDEGRDEEIFILKSPFSVPHSLLCFSLSLLIFSCLQFCRSLHFSSSSASINSSFQSFAASMSYIEPETQ